VPEGAVIYGSNPQYYTGTYWNDFHRVQEYMAENFTGDKQKWWTQDFKERFAVQPFEHGLFLNCGNGWVERDFVDEAIVKRATAFDYSHDLLCEASTKRERRPIHYFQADANKVDFNADQFDLIVNVAALHHVQYINRLSYILCKTLKESGLFVNFDYIGPARNQYSRRHWYWIRQVNQSLPDFIRKSPLRKHHLPTMLYSDPTEAIHSDLIFPTLSRYFEIIERHDTGGGIAYEILTHNAKLTSIPPEQLNPYIDQILAFDKKYTEEKKVPPLFSYFIAKPRKKKLVDWKKIRYYQELEDRREESARRMRWVYSNGDYLVLILHSIHTHLAHIMAVRFLKGLRK
jgi:ubiquinone/menaquinone biosynthesis C-methylase UbiE